MALAKLVRRTKRERSLTTLIASRIKEERVLLPPQADDWFRVSSLYKVCAREEVLCHRHEVTRTDKIDPSLSLIFSHGHGLHYALQNIVLPKCGIIIGQWLCKQCGKKHGGKPKNGDLERGLCFRPERCRRCGAGAREGDDDTDNPFLYNELYFRDEDLRIHGHTDSFLRMPGVSSPGIGEIKSIGLRGGYEIRKAPRLDHVIQAQAYLMLTGLNWAVIIYWIKGEVGTGAIVEHFVERDDETINSIRGMVRSIRQGIRDDVLPDRICAKKDCTRAKECSVTKQCFGNGEAK